MAYNARGYPPSDVPDDEQSYSQDRARDDVRAVLDGLSIEQAHIVGISMGGFATLHFLMKRTIPSAALVMLPRSGHTINLEEPALFNRFLEQFFHQVESGRWQVRDPRSITDRIL
jgi:pimeloyl-ACP methyl ester carboxylesterase